MAEPYKLMFNRIKRDPDELERLSREAGETDADDLWNEIRLQSGRLLMWLEFQNLAELDQKEIHRIADQQIWDLVATRAKTALEKSGERPTKERIEAKAVLDEDYILARSEDDKAQAVVKTCTNTVAAIYEKSKMLQSLNARQNKELETSNKG